MAFRNEEWKKVKFDFEFTNDFELEISNMGRARSYTKIADGKILKGTIMHGYRVLHLRLFKPRTTSEKKRLDYLKSQITMMHGLLLPFKTKLKSSKKKNQSYFEARKKSAEHFIAGHLDHNKLNNRFENLKWMTQEENILHQQNSPKVIAEYKLRLSRRPLKSYSFKLTETRVMLLKKMIRKGTRIKTLSKQFGVTEMQVRRIKSGENWGDVKAAN